ncbi:hypothetical protein C7B65_22055 [Phormidesmis priestleyi ULC007]|uniref:Uncharacterized protein n=1 Tax=Phormidesmis priestleyi ULC007 TaxID=1920490 RepID=A0A2T1D789_9CYAN|nr:hypothetical protein [Phormidesmis priestleyi]PSB16311.1 hypothetical protein C7B65_22055 [Phormidesmis priestleyi ULC007]PZO46990.1 MAG: hypothetical protein DCF14_21105 [Phormidesmis priestleyi]
MSGMSWLKICLVPLLCYVPAFVLVGWSSNIFKPASTDSQLLNSANLESRVREEVGKQIVLRKTTSQAEIQRQISDEIKKEIANQENKMKGDLFEQISFPVVFAIASIFAAFAVKDILTEILKEPEKEKLKLELQRELENQIVPNAIKSERFTKRLQTVESHTNWLEHELLNIEIAQIIDEAKIYPEFASKETEQRTLSAIDKLLDRSNVTLDRAEFRQEDLEKLRQFEHMVLRAKVKSLKLSETSKDSFLFKIDERFQPADKENTAELIPESIHDRLEGVFHMEMSLLIATLSKLGENDLSNEVANYAYTDRPRRINERRRQAEEQSKKNPTKFE